MFRLETLGAVRLLDHDGLTLTVPPRRLALLTVLGAAGERGASREQLTHLLSSSKATADPRHALEQALYALRQQLHPDLFHLGHRIARAAGILDCDVEEFERLAAAGELEAAAALYRGPFLDGFVVRDAPDYERWVEEERGRLARVQLSVLARLADRNHAAGRYEAAAEAWSRFRQIDPLSASGAGGLIRSLAASGDRAGALQVAEAYRSLLRDELGCLPDPEVLQLIETIASPPARSGASEPSDGSVAVVGPSETSPSGSGGKLSDRLSSRLSKRRLLIASIAVTGIVVVASLLAVRRGWGPPEFLDSNTVVVIPLEWTGPGTAGEEIANDFVDLMAVRLTGEGGFRAVPAPKRPASHLRPTKLAPEESPAETRRLADEAGAAWVLGGSVAAGGDGLVLTVSLRRVDSAVPRMVTVASGRPAALDSMADQIAARVLAVPATASDKRLATATTLPPYRAYLAGRADFIRGHWAEAAAHFRRAMALDSTFAQAAVALRRASHLSDGMDVDASARLAWRYRDRLDADQRGLLVAELGEGYPAFQASGEALRRLRSFADLHPRYPGGWAALGSVLLVHGPILGVQGWREEGRFALAQALSLDSLATDARTALIDIAATGGEVEALHTLVASAPAEFRADASDTWWRWLAAFVRRDTAEMVLARGSLSQLDRDHLWHLRALVLRTGVDMAGAAEAQRLLADRATTPMQRSEAAWGAYSLSLTRGRPVEAAKVAPQILLEWPPVARQMVAVLSAVYGGSDETAAEEALLAIAPLADAQAQPGHRREGMMAACVTAQWRLMRGQMGISALAMQKLRSTAPELPPWFISQNRLCTAWVEAELALAGSEPRARALLAGLDSLARSGEAASWSFPSHRAIAHAWLQAGEPVRALAAVRRRELGWYVADDLEEEGRLALLVGDTAGALLAWRRYLDLRDDPELAVRPRVENLRVLVASLTR